MTTQTKSEKDRVVIFDTTLRDGDEYSKIFESHAQTACSRALTDRPAIPSGQ